MIILSGGTGTPKLLPGLEKVFKGERLTIVVNTAEDVWISGNLLCPDLDSVLYTLGGLINKETWWGVKNDSFSTHAALQDLPNPERLMIGDRDRATHIARSELLRQGKTLTEATAALARSFGIPERITILPMTDAPAAVCTKILTPDGELHFQEFWVEHRGEPEVLDVRFEAIESAKPSAEVIAALEDKSDPLVLFGPSNPVTSIGPILALEGVRELLKWKVVVAISPIVGAAAVSGPAGKFMRAKGFEVSPYGVYSCYKDLLDVLIIDKRDVCTVSGGVDVLQTDILMKKERDSKRIATFLKGKIPR
ncbi:MAG TPA: 2-phospho-L-lactate transferase [Methanomicrobia archaeon]|nr:2-phospho-L-lactate transferase [Methanomicrobia archaeon]